MAQAAVQVTAEPFGPTRTGVWCERCLLPSALSRSFAFSLGSRLTLDTVTACPQCGAVWRHDGIDREEHPYG